MDAAPVIIAPEQAGLTVAALLRQFLPGRSWNEVRRLVAARRVTIGGDLCFDPARRLKEGEAVSNQLTIFIGR